MTNYAAEIRSFIVDNFLFGRAGNLQETTSLMNEGIIDSTGVLELAMHLETAYGIKMDDAELVPENLDSIKLISGYIERKMAARDSAA